MKRFLLISLVTFLAILGALTIYVRYGGQDQIVIQPIEVVE
jgi:hypothetical protein